MNKIFLLVLLFSIIIIPTVVAEDLQPRGNYIYDSLDKLSFETELAINSYLLGIDIRTHYEFVVSIQSSKLEEDEILKWFNDHGIGKKGEDTGACIFIFPDNTWFMCIGSGNDKVSVAYSKTQGDRILSNLSSDYTLSLMRYIHVIGNNIDEPKPIQVQIYNSVAENLDIILGYILIISLIFLLIQQFDGFQLNDLIIPTIVALIALSVVGIASVANDIEANTYNTFGYIISSYESSYIFTEVHSNGKTTWTDTHTMYVNDVKFESYEYNIYSYTFKSQDSRSAWTYDIGQLYKLTIEIKDNDLWDISNLNDNSGGITIGDGCWG
jgi:hypothetical protein